MVGTSLPRVMLASALLLVLGLQAVATIPAAWAESRGVRVENPKPVAGKNQVSDKSLAEFGEQSGSDFYILTILANNISGDCV